MATNIEHKDIVDVDRHEPKGASSASLGQVLSSNGDGTTSFTDLPSFGSAQIELGYQTTNGQTSVTMTGIPNDATEIVVMLEDVSTNDAGEVIQIRFGTDVLADVDSGSNYYGRAVASNGSAVSTGTTYFPLTNGVSITQPVNGMWIFKRAPTTDKWFCFGGFVGGTTTSSSYSSGYYSPASGSVDRINISTAVTALDAGFITVTYRT